MTTEECKNCGFEQVYKLKLCEECYASSTILVKADGTEYSWYTPQPHQRPYHTSNAPYLLIWGPRGTGKSLQMRKDAILRCITWPNYKVLILRRKIPDLRKSHLQFIGHEMSQLGEGVGYYRETTFDVKFVNSSLIQFSHCEKMKDVENYLSSQWDMIIFDEVSTFPLEMFLTICSACRSTVDAPCIALIRGGSNTVGVGSAWMRAWFIDHVVDYAEYPDYNPLEFESIFSRLEENRYLPTSYVNRLKILPEHLKRAYLYGEFIVEGAYFPDFIKVKKEGEKTISWHTINVMPTIKETPIHQVSWMNVYRSVDWGYSPDPAVCHWHVITANKRKITFKERTWTRILAADVAKEIKEQSAGMHVVETFCDPTMFEKTGETAYSIGEIFEQNGVPLTASKNDRELFGYSIHEMLNTLIEDTELGTALPSWQILEYACPELIRTLPLLEMDKSNPAKVANGPDHWAISCAYFAMGGAPPSRDPVAPTIQKWRQPKHKHRNLGS